MWFATLLLVIACCCAQEKNTYLNPLVPHYNSPDPGVLKLFNDTYIAVTTSENEADCYPLRISHDMVEWKLVTHVFPRERRPAWANASFWAPEIHQIDGHFYCYYAARDYSGRLCLGVGIANHFLGPFVDLGRPLLRDEHVGMIDPTHYFDSVTQKHYLIWKEDGNDIGRSTPIYIQQLVNGTELVGQRSVMIRNTLEWEGPLVEGPWLIKRNEYYYLFYSANAFYNEKYAVGVARSKNLFGPYEKHPTPILHTGTKWIGPGHCSVVPALHNPQEFVMVYHSWLQGHVGGSENNRLFLQDTVHWTSDDWPYIEHDTPSETEQKVE